MTPEPPKSHKVDNPKVEKATTPESLIIQNGQLVEQLFTTPGWEIIEDLIDEGIASVSGRKTNGYYYSGSLTRGDKDKQYLTGYQEALTQLYNRIKDFVIAKDKFISSKKQEEVAKLQPIINPFMEEEDGIFI